MRMDDELHLFETQQGSGPTRRAPPRGAQEATTAACAPLPS